MDMQHTYTIEPQVTLIKSVLNLDLHFQTWRWRHYISPKCWYSQRVKILQDHR